MRAGAGALGREEEPFIGGSCWSSSRSERLCGQASFGRPRSVPRSWPVFILVMFLFVPVYEEPTLRATFGDPYVRYCERVQRWWPRPHAGGRPPGAA